MKELVSAYKMKIFFTLWIFLCAGGFMAVWSDKKTAIEGGTITVTCPYDVKRYMFSTKYWCKGSSRMSCDILGDTEKFIKQNYKSRLILIDNWRGYFFVTMKQLAASDSGTYWCGIHRPYMDIMTEVQMEVNKAPEEHTYLETTISSITFSSTEVTTAFPVYSKSNTSVSLPPNSTCNHNVEETNWHFIPWAILRWLILLILITTFVKIC